MVTKILGLCFAALVASPQAHADRAKHGQPKTRIVELIILKSGGASNAAAEQGFDGRGRQQADDAGFPADETSRLDVRTAAPSALPRLDYRNSSTLIDSWRETNLIFVPAWMRSDAVYLPVAPNTSCYRRSYRPSGLLTVVAEARRQTFYSLMTATACRYGLPVDLFDAMIIRESRYDPSVVSAKDAFGLTQLMPGTANDLRVDRYDVAQNLLGGAAYLRRQFDRFGKYHLALAAYNAGPARVRGEVPPIRETRRYVDAILRDWSSLAGIRPAAGKYATGADQSALVQTKRSVTIQLF